MRAHSAVTEGFPETTLIRSVQDVPNSVDLVWVLGHNICQEWDADRVLKTPDLLSTDSIINTLAAGQVWTPGRTIVFSGGQKLGPDLPFQAEAAKSYFTRRFPSIPDEDILTETTGYSTPKSAEAFRRIMDSGNFGHAALLSVGYHLEYAPTSFAQLDAPVETAIVSEDILSERSRLYANFITSWRELGRIKREQEYSAGKLNDMITVDFGGADSDARTRERVYQGV